MSMGIITIVHAVLDTLLLIHVPLNVRLHALRGCGARVARLRIVFLFVDVGACGVLRFIQPQLLARAHMAAQGTDIGAGLDAANVPGPTAAVMAATVAGATKQGTR